MIFIQDSTLLINVFGLWKSKWDQNWEVPDYMKQGEKGKSAGTDSSFWNLLHVIWLNKLSIQRQERVKCALFHFSHASRLFHCCATASAVEQGLMAGKGSMVWSLLQLKCNILALVFQHPEHVPHQWSQGKTQSRRSWTSRVHKRVAQLGCSLGKTVMKKILIKKQTNNSLLSLCT